MRRALFGLVMSGLAASCLALPAALEPAHAQALPEPPRMERIEGPSVDGFDFPSEIAGLPRVGVMRYGEPGLGFSVRYGSPTLGTWADIYVYDREQRLSGGSTAVLVRQEIQDVLAEIDEAVRLGLYSRAAVTGGFAEGDFEGARLRMVRKGEPLDSYVLLTIRDAKFVKIRLSSHAGPNSDRIAASFAKAYARPGASGTDRKKKRAP